MTIEVGHPCPYCAVRPDVACSHREADPNWKLPNFEPEPEDEPKMKKARTGNGLNFRVKRRYVSGGGLYRKKGPKK